MKAQVKYWDEIHTAYQVARLGTLSAAAEYLDIHHSTVTRHITALEKRLGAKLFYRHARGYVPTDAGKELLRVAAATDDQLEQMAARIRGYSAEVSGELVITTLDVVAPVITSWLPALLQKHQGLRVSLLTGNQVLKLEYGEAHIAVRAGPKPQEPDNVVQHLLDYTAGLYAHRDYVEVMGGIESLIDLPRHRFLLSTHASRGSPIQRWMSHHVPTQSVVFKASNARGMQDALFAGVGVAPLADWAAISHPELVQVMPPRPEWRSDLWLVTHVDQHRTEKVQVGLSFLKGQASLLRDKLSC